VRNDRPSIVLVVIDTLRADGLTVYGNAQTTSPHLDALAGRGVRFTRAYSHAPWTTPSVASLLASRYPSALGIDDERSRVPEDTELLQEVLARHGYATAAVVSHSFCSERWGFAQGFDLFDESNVRGHDAVVGEAVTDRALELLDRLEDRPFFLFLHYFDPHVAYIEHPGFTFRDGTGAPYDGPIRSGMKFKTVSGLRLDAADHAEMRRLYDSEVAFTDHHIGRLLERLDRETVIVVTADHGEEFDDHGRLGHAKTLYDELIRVPLILACPQSGASVPGCDARRVVDRPVGLLDVAPTLLRIAGVPAPEGFEGRSLLDEPAGAPRPVFSETSRHSVLRSVVLGRHKLILDAGTGKGMLFDLIDDPGERTDLASRETGKAQELMRLLEGWTVANRPGAGGTGEIALTPAERERLAALGYLEEGEPGNPPSGDQEEP
jgi:arylsulfatase A-like enzyme